MQAGAALCHVQTNPANNNRSPFFPSRSFCVAYRAAYLAAHPPAPAPRE